MVPFPKIGQYRGTVRAASHRGRPTLRFLGTPKLHGTNSSIVRMPDGEIRFQSRNRVLTGASDHFGFVSHMTNAVGLTRLRALIDEHVGVHPVPVVVYGEWCGLGIQQQVAISEVAPLFAIFCVRVGVEEDDTTWLDLRELTSLKSPEDRIFNVLQFASFELDIDFTAPDQARDQLIAKTVEVERQCPAGAFFGVEGVGEGVVWRCVSEGFNDPAYWFKVKGEKHSVSRVKKLAPANVERMTSIESFLDSVLTEARMRQATGWLVEQGHPLARSSTGEYLRWLFGDILSEESDTMEASGLTRKDIGGPLSHRARRWFFTWLDTEAIEADGQE
ncbi:MAG: hypothetical protein ACI8RZ_003942 [Myxococcota bacterium]|jgi:hypothetical protein